MDKIPTLDSKIEKTITLSEEETSDLLLSTFYYSQGSSTLQRNLFCYIAALNPTVRLPQFTHKSLLEREFPRYERITRGEGHIVRDKGVIESQILKERYAMQVAFNAKEKVSLGVVRQSVLQDLIAQDHRSLYSKERQNPDFGQKGRPAEIPRPGDGPFRAHISHFVEYLIEGKKPPGPAYFSQVIESLRDAIRDRDVVAALLESEIGYVRDLLKVQPAPLEDFPALRARIEALAGPK
jgi:hypothetical protein